MNIVNTYIENFSKDCARNYAKGVEFSIRLTFGGWESVYNFPKGAKELQYLSIGKLTKVFEECVYDFLGKATEKLGDDERYQLKIQILPLVSSNYEYATTTFNK